MSLELFSDEGALLLLAYLLLRNGLKVTRETFF
ncbi:MAG: hypothetical protein K0R24_383 [Gammaproteobacteria bacterium]|jgi:hypothetical protein|nr:hypothetical protein [Gammaproteobacteria bacterium]